MRFVLYRIHVQMRMRYDLEHCAVKPRLFPPPPARGSTPTRTPALASYGELALRDADFSLWTLFDKYWAKNVQM